MTFAKVDKTPYVKVLAGGAELAGRLAPRSGHHAARCTPALTKTTRLKRCRTNFLRRRIGTAPMNIFRNAAARGLGRRVASRAFSSRAATFSSTLSRLGAGTAAAITAGSIAYAVAASSEHLATCAGASAAPGKSITDDYDIDDKMLGEGAFAKVFRGRSKTTGKEVAIKVVNKSKQSASSIRHELEVLKRVSLHKCIAELIAYYETNDRFYIVMELVTGGELFDRLVDYGAFSEREAATLVQELGGAIALLHAQGLCHADIKPENLMLTDDGHVKLVDFGLSVTSEFDQRVGTATAAATGQEGLKLGTPAYWPPEMFNDPKASPNPAGDMWALGVVLYILLTARHPFDDLSMAITKRNVTELEGDALWGGWPASESSRRFVEALLRKDPNNRLTVEQLLQHPWLSEAAPAIGQPADPSARAREAELHKFRLDSSRLRAAAFAVMLRQQAHDRQEVVSSGGRLKLKRQSTELRRIGSVRANLIEHDLLARCFREFDREGKGFLTEADLQRVLASFGHEIKSGDDELHSILQAAAGYDREGRAVTYGNFVRTMAHAVKQTLDEGEMLFKQGDPTRYFYLLLSGEVALVIEKADGSEVIDSYVDAGDFFGEDSLLTRASVKSTSAKCTMPSEVLKLAKADFEVGFLGKPMDTIAKEHSHWWGRDAEITRRETLLRFIQMVTGSREPRELVKDQVVFNAGDAADRFFIVTDGTLEVSDPRSSRPIAKVKAGEPCGEMALLAGKPTHTKDVKCITDKCAVVGVDGGDFLRLVRKSDAVRAGFEKLHRKRSEENERTAPP